MSNTRYDQIEARCQGQGADQLSSHLTPALQEFLDGLAEIIARDLHRKGWGPAVIEGHSPAMVENETC